MTIFLYKQVVVHFVNDSESEGNCNFDWQRGAKGDLLEVCTNSCPATPLNCEGITIKAPAFSGFLDLHHDLQRREEEWPLSTGHLTTMTMGDTLSDYGRTEEPKLRWSKNLIQKPKTKATPRPQGTEMVGKAWTSCDLGSVHLATSPTYPESLFFQTLQGSKENAPNLRSYSARSALPHCS